MAKKFRTQYNYVPKKSEAESYNLLTEPSVTIPNMHKSLDDIFKLSLNGIGYDYKNHDVYDGEIDEIDFNNFPVERIEDFSIDDAIAFAQDADELKAKLQTLQTAAKEKVDKADKANNEKTTPPADGE